MFSLLPFLSACAAPEPAAGVVTSSPTSGPQYGYATVRFELADAGTDPTAVTDAWLGGVRLLDLQPDGTGLLATVQGAPAAGPADLVLETPQGTETWPGAHTYTAPVDPLFDRFLAFGASLTQGVQGGVPSPHGSLHGPSAQAARMAGAFHPQPLLLDDILPEITAADIGEAPDCRIPSTVNHVGQAAAQVITQLSDPETGEMAYWAARQDPDLMPRNLAVGDHGIAHLAYGPPDNDFAKQFMSHLVYDPYGGLTDPVPYSQLELVEDAAPTLVLCSETYGNDAIKSVVMSGHIDLDKLTDPAVVEDAAHELADRLAATGAEVFLGNVPDATLLPAAGEIRRSTEKRARERAIEAGEDPDAAAAEALAEVDADIAVVQEMGETYAALLQAAADRHDNVHIVDFYAMADQIAAEGLPIGDQVVTAGKFGGLIGVDGIHFTDTGYALMANTFLDAVEAETGVVVPQVDLEAVIAADRHSPAALRAAGLDPDACTQ